VGHSFYGCCGARRRSMWEWRTDTYPGGPYGAAAHLTTVPAQPTAASDAHRRAHRHSGSGNGNSGASNGYAGTNGCTHCNPGAYLHAGAHSPAAVPDATNPDAYARRNQG
jgi:hypothetical protein